MAFTLRDGARTWKGKTDDDGYRTYTVVFRAWTNDPRDGPAQAMQTPGLPVVGSAWSIDNDVDQWAWFRAGKDLRPVIEEGKGPNKAFDIEMTASNKPPDPTKQRCQDQRIEDPLLEPVKINVSTTRFQEEAVEDNQGNLILNSAHEMFRGPLVEFDKSRPTVRLESNELNHGIEIIMPMVDTLNSVPMWGLPERCIKLSQVTLERRFYGLCYVYWNRVLEFELSYGLRDFLQAGSAGHGSVSVVTSQRLGGLFDRVLMDEGSKVLRGHWDLTTGVWVLDNINGVAPDPKNASHFIRARDRLDQPIRIMLNGAGLPAEVSGLVSPPAGITLEQLTPGTLTSVRRYTVTATNANGETTAGPIVPIDLDIPSSVLVTWAASVGATGYKVYRSDNPQSPPRRIAIVGNELEYTDVGVNPTAIEPPAYNTATVDGEKIGRRYLAKYGQSNFFILGNVPVTF